MINTTTQQNQNTGMSFFRRYKKWFLALAVWQMLMISPLFIVAGYLGYTVVSTIIGSSELRAHPFKLDIIAGFKAGYEDGEKDYSFGDGRSGIVTAWWSYQDETDQLEQKSIAEKEEYLAQFPESERGAKRAEMKLNNIKLPLELELKQRFTNALQFYTNLVEQKVKRENYKSDEEYQEAVEQEAFKAGYEYGYGDGYHGVGNNLKRDLSAFRNRHRQL